MRGLLTYTPSVRVTYTLMSVLTDCRRRLRPPWFRHPPPLSEGITKERIGNRCCVARVLVKRSTCSLYASVDCDDQRGCNAQDGAPARKPTRRGCRAKMANLEAADEAARLAAIEWLKGLRCGETWRFRFSEPNPPTLIATSVAAMLGKFLGWVDALSDAERAASTRRSCPQREARCRSRGRQTHGTPRAQKG